MAVKQLLRARVTGILCARPPPALPDFISRPLKNGLVGRILPFHQLADDLKEPFPLQISGAFLQRGLRARGRRTAFPRASFVQGCAFRPGVQTPLQFPARLSLHRGVRKKLIGIFRWIVHHLREDHRPRRGQRPPRPPEVQRARMTVPDRLLPRRRRIDRVERKGDLNQLLTVSRIFSHHASPRGA